MHKTHWALIVAALGIVGGGLLVMRGLDGQGATVSHADPSTASPQTAEAAASDHSADVRVEPSSAPPVASVPAPVGPSPQQRPMPVGIAPSVPVAPPGATPQAALSPRERTEQDRLMDEVADHYSQVIERQLAENNIEARLEGLRCAQSACKATLAERAPDALQRWMEVMKRDLINTADQAMFRQYTGPDGRSRVDFVVVIAKEPRP